MVGDVLDAGHVEPGVGEGLGPEERAHQVVGLQADHRRDARRAVPVLERPPAGQGHRHQPGVGVEGVGTTDGEQERDVEDAVGVGVAVGRGRRRGRPPTGRRRPACPSPQTNPPVQPAGVAAVGLAVAGGDHVVEARAPRPGGPPGRAATWWPARWPVPRPGGRPAPRGPRAGPGRSGPPRPACRPAGWPRPSDPASAGRGPGQADEGHGLAERVVEAVQETARRAAGGPPASTPSATMASWNTGPLADRISVRSRSTKTAPVASAMPSPYRRRPATGPGQRPQRAGRRPDRLPAPGRGKGTTGGEGGPFALTQQG